MPHAIVHLGAGCGGTAGLWPRMILPAPASPSASGGLDPWPEALLTRCRQRTSWKPSATRTWWRSSRRRPRCLFFPRRLHREAAESVDFNSPSLLRGQCPHSPRRRDGRGHNRKSLLSRACRRPFGCRPCGRRTEDASPARRRDHPFGLPPVPPPPPPRAPRPAPVALRTPVPTPAPYPPLRPSRLSLPGRRRARFASASPDNPHARPHRNPARAAGASASRGRRPSSPRWRMSPRRLSSRCSTSWMKLSRRAPRHRRP